MKNLYNTLLFCLVILNGYSQCINTTPYGSAIITGCNTGTITGCNYALEYSELTFNTTGTYTFASSVSSDWLTLTTAANVVIAFGQQPLVATIPSIGNYRLHVSTNNACGTQSTCRLTTYACGAISTATGCIQPSAYGTATINSYGSAQITACNWAGEYSQLTIGVAGLYTFESSVSTDFLTLTDASNVILFSGITPLNASITNLGNYRLHVSTSSLCGTENICRITSYTCAPITPCSGTPNAGTAHSNETTICSSQNVNFNLLGATVASSLTYQWQSSPNNSTWTNIGGQINSTMSQYVTSTMYYRCIVACGTNSAASTSQQVVVGGVPIGGTAVASPTMVCIATNINLSLIGGNSSWPGLTYQWQSSPNNTTWTNLFGYNSSSALYLANTPLYYKCVIACGSNSATSTSVYVAASPNITYATLPLYENFDNAWQNRCDIHNVPSSNNWDSEPRTGSNSWRRQDDGSSANWTGFVVEAPYSGSGCANFHSTEAVLSAKGDLDAYVNMNQVGKYAISYYYINPTGNDNLSVLISNDGGTSYSIKGFNGTQTTWTKKTIYYNTILPSPQSIVRFRGEGPTSTTNDDLAIDSLSIRFICSNPTINATASSSAICVGQTTTLTALGASSYTWMPGAITGSVAVVSPIVNTGYVLTATNDGLCFPTSVVTVSVASCANGINEVENDKNISVYPNPAKDIIEIDFLNDNYIATKVVMTDVLGKVIYQTTGLKQHQSINIQAFPSGVYFLKVDNYKTIRVIKD